MIVVDHCIVANLILFAAEDRERFVGACRSLVHPIGTLTLCPCVASYNESQTLGATVKKRQDITEQCH